jgi:asparagine synthase (glutamine-hydrolysing)
VTGIAARTPAGEPEGDNERQVRSLVEAMPRRGRDFTRSWSDDRVAIAAATHEWQAGLVRPHGQSSGGPVATRGACAIAADATLYYREDLARAITGAGVAVDGISAAELILAAYAAFGDAFLTRLEGDFAFVLWDGTRRRLLAARDFAGKRPVFYCAGDGWLTVASAIGGVLADPRVPVDLNVASIAATAAGLWRHGADTCRTSVRELPAAHVLTWEEGRPAAVTEFWQPPTSIAAGPSLDEAALHVLELLTRATEERLAEDGPTAISLSGGWDSTAVFGAGQRALQRAATSSRALRPASLSFPKGDPGDEDDFIAETAAFWHTTTEWIRADDVPMFGDLRAAAQARDEPFSHPFEGTNRALAKAARRLDARVMLDGSGGDQLFAVSDVYLADILRSGRLLRLIQQWQARRDRSIRALYRNAVRPCLSDGALAALARIRGHGAPRHYLDRPIPVWFRHAFLEAHGILSQERTARPNLPRSSAVLAEMHAYLRFPYAARIAAHVTDYLQSEGVEARSPLLDARVVAFAGSRPWHDKVDGRETKVLLRRAMRGALPERLLAPRPHKTGLMTGYFVRGVQRAAGELAPLLAGGRLADLGVINPDTLRRAWDYFLQSADQAVGGQIYYTLQTESWLREHDAGGLAGERLAPHPARAAT